MALTPTQKNSIQNLYTAIVGPLKVKYGASVQLEGVSFPLNEAGAVKGMMVTIKVESAPDPDGETRRFRKTIDLW